MQAKTLNLVMHKVEKETGIDIPTAKKLNTTLQELDKESTLNAEGLAEEIGVAITKAEEIISILEELGIIELIPFGNKVKSIVKLASKIYKVIKA